MIKKFRKQIRPTLMSILIFTGICGIMYTGVVTMISQTLFPYQANGSLVKVGDTIYGSKLMGQAFTQEKYLWGRFMQPSTVKVNNEWMMYAGPANMSPASDVYAKDIQQRLHYIKAAHPTQHHEKVPVELITQSGSGLDPHISPSAAKYQVARIAKERQMSVAQVQKIIDQCTDEKILGIFGESTVNVLEVNLMLDEIVKT